MRTCQSLRLSCSPCNRLRMFMLCVLLQRHFVNRPLHVCVCNIIPITPTLAMLRLRQEYIIEAIEAAQLYYSSFDQTPSPCVRVCMAWYQCQK